MARFYNSILRGAEEIIQVLLQNKDHWLQASLSESKDLIQPII